MARKVIHQLVDDVDGTVLDPDTGETVRFALDGREYEIDLSDRNAKDLRSDFAKWISVSRRASTAAPRRGRRESEKRNDLDAVRTWARENGHAVSDRGRVAKTILEAYDKANS